MNNPDQIIPPEESKFKIIILNNPASPAQNPNDEVRMPVLPIEKTLDQIGRKLIKQKNLPDWISMPQLARRCCNHKVLLEGRFPNSARLEDLVGAYFQQYDTLMVEGFTIRWRAEYPDRTRRMIQSFKSFLSFNAWTPSKTV
jgi:hypothetical protein